MFRAAVTVCLLLLPISAWGRSYTTNFGLTENPISESGNWLNGQANGLAWTNVRTTPGLAFGTQIGTQSPPQQFADSTAVVAGAWGQNQTAQAVVVNTLASSNLNIAAEVELRINTTITANNITGYECLFSVRPIGENPPGRYMQIVRWNGALANFTFIDGRDIGSTLQTGDVVTCSRSGATITATAKRGGATLQSFSVTDSTHLAGGPGVGFYLQNASGFNSQYGFSSFVATDGILRTAATCNTADVQAAHTASANGDLILCPAGSFTWSGLALTKAVRLHGAGAGVTIIAITGNNTFTKSAAGIMQIDGFTMNETGGGATSQFMTIGGSWKAAYPIVWTNNAFNVSNSGLFDVGVAGGSIWARNTFTAGWNDSIIHLKNPSDSDGSWTSVDTMGVNDAASRLSGTIAGTSGYLNHYVEDNTITGGTTQGLDCDDGCRIVFRHNTTSNFEFNSHGLGTSAIGNRHWEIYANDMRNTCSRGTDCGNNSNQQHMFLLRGGTGVIYDNVTDNMNTSTWGNKQEANLSQDSNHDASGVNCQPVPGPYPLSHQLGSGYNGTAQFVDPIYLWHNTVNTNGSSPFTFNLAVDFFYTCPLTISDYVQAGREYVNNSGSTTAKPGYTAFTYPHPLTVGTGGGSGGGTGGPTTRIASSCNSVDVQTQVTASVDGDIILIPAGTCSWSPGITVNNKSLRFHGAGQSVTTISLVGGTTFLNFTGNSAGGFVAEVDGMTFTGAGNANGWFTATSTYPVRFHHNTITATANRHIFWTGTYGLIDHNLFSSVNGANSIQILGSQFTPSGRWAQTMDFASINQVFIEDNTFTSTNCNTGLGSFDGFNGSKIHYRHNIQVNQQTYVHGYDTAGESALWTLITDNTFDMALNPCAIDRVVFIRGGTGLVQNNTFHQTQPNNLFNPTFVALAYFRSSLSQQGSICGDGSAHSLSVDLYTGTPTGYPCFEQTGFGAPWPTVAPWYECNNTGTGTRPANQQMLSESIHVVAGRDFFNDTCKPGFVEFTYPHPYQTSGGGPPSDTTPPTNPSSLVATAVSTSQINLAWTASTDNVGVTAYLVERCLLAGCTNWAQITSTSGTSLIDTGLTPSRRYRYRVRATDAAGNLSGYSNIAFADTFDPDTTPPSVPTGLTATTISKTRIDLAWTASTDDVAVLNYQVFRCTGSGCTPTVQIATSIPTTFSDITAVCSTTYNYAVRAVDTSNNLSALSSPVTGTTLSCVTPPLAPTGFTLQAVSDFSRDSGSWSWTQATGGAADGFRVKCGKIAADRTLVVTVPNTAARTLYIRQFLPGQGTWFCTVVAYNVGGESAEAVEVSTIVIGPGFGAWGFAF